MSMLKGKIPDTTFSMGQKCLMGFQKPNKYPLLIPSFFYIICKKCFKMMLDGVRPFQLNI